MKELIQSQIETYQHDNKNIERYLDDIIEQKDNVKADDEIEKLTKRVQFYMNRYAHNHGAVEALKWVTREMNRKHKDANCV